MGSLRSRGFTLIELLVVIAIIGILASVVLASLNSAREKARNAGAVAQIKEYQKAFELYYSNHGRYPGNITAGTEWACLGTGYQSGRCWSGSAHTESSAQSVQLRSDLSGYIDPTVTAGPTSGSYKGSMYRRSNDSSYMILLVLEGDVDCPIGTKNSTVYAGVTRCDYTKN